MAGVLEPISLIFRVFFGISRYGSLLSFRSKFNAPVQIEAQGFACSGIEVSARAGNGRLDHPAASSQKLRPAPAPSSSPRLVNVGAGCCVCGDLSLGPSSE